MSKSNQMPKSQLAKTAQKFQCKYCDASFSHKTNMYRHRRADHGHMSESDTSETSASDLGEVYMLDEEAMSNLIKEGVLTFKDALKLSQVKFSLGVEEAFSKAIASKAITLKEYTLYDSVLSRILVKQEVERKEYSICDVLNIGELLNLLKESNTDGYAKILTALKQFNLDELVSQIISKDTEAAFMTVFKGSLEYHDDSICYRNGAKVDTVIITDEVLLNLWKILVNSLYYYISQLASVDLNHQLARRAELSMRDMSDPNEGTYYRVLDTSVELFRKMEGLNYSVWRDLKDTLKVIKNSLKSKEFFITIC